MKTIWLALLFCTSTAFAAEGVVTSSAPRNDLDMTKTNFTEFGMQMSSINKGTMFADISLGHDFNEWFTGMTRGFLPMDYNRASQTYAGQLVGRFNLMNDINTVYLEATLTQGYFTPQVGSTSAFGMFGANYGYAHRFSGDFTLGVNLGIDYSSNKIAHDDMVASNTLLSHLAVVGGYYF